MKRLKLNIIRSILGVVVSGVLFLLSTGYSFGWFSSNKTVSGSGMGITVSDVSSLTIDYSVYRYFLDTNSVLPQPKGPKEFEMNEHDKIIISRNNYTALFVYVELGGVNSLTTSVSINISRTDAGDRAIKHYTSEFMDFKCAGYSASSTFAAFYAEQNLTTYTAVHKYFDSTDAFYFSTTDRITLDVPVAQADFDQNGKLRLIFEIDYDETRTDSIELLLGGSNKILFENDIDNIEFDA